MNSNLITPRQAPPVLFKEKIAYTHWLKLYRKIPKPERFGVGEKIDILFLELFETTYEMRFASAVHELPYLEKAITKIDKIKFLLEIAWENKLINTKHYSELLEQLEGIGRELGGWKKGLTNKNSRS